MHCDFLAGANVRHPIGKQVGALLLHQARLLASRFRGLIDRLCLRPLLDHTDDAAIAQLHLQRTHGGIVRQREGVHPFQVAIRVIAECLLHLHGGDHAIDLEVHLTVMYQCRYKAATGIVPHQQMPAANAIGPGILNLLKSSRSGGRNRQ